MSAVLFLLFACAAALVLTAWSAHVVQQEQEQEQDGCVHEAFMDGRCMVCGTPADSIEVYPNDGGNR